MDDNLDVLNMQSSSIEKDVETLENFDVEQKMINEKMGDKMEEMSAAQHSMALEQRGQHETLKGIGKTLERIERNGR